MGRFFKKRKLIVNRTKEFVIQETGPVSIYGAFIDALKRVENAAKVGYNEENNSWLPHKSLEGGTDTIGYGHKLDEAEHAGRFVKYGQSIYTMSNEFGIPDDIIELIFIEDIDTALKLAWHQWDSIYSPNVNYYIEGAPVGHNQVNKSFADLDLKYRLLLVDLVFNVGTLEGWPKLCSGIINGNDKVVYKECLRYYFGENGEKYPLYERRDIICEALNIKG